MFGLWAAQGAVGVPATLQCPEKALDILPVWVFYMRSGSLSPPKNMIVYWIGFCNLPLYVNECVIACMNVGLASHPCYISA